MAKPHFKTCAEYSGEMFGYKGELTGRRPPLRCVKMRLEVPRSHMPALIQSLGLQPRSSTNRRRVYQWDLGTQPPLRFHLALSLSNLMLVASPESSLKWHHVAPPRRSGPIDALARVWQRASRLRPPVGAGPAVIFD